MLKIPSLLPGLPGLMARLIPFAAPAEAVEADEVVELDYDLRYLRSLAVTGGTPMLLLPPDMAPAGWLEAQGR